MLNPGPQGWTAIALPIVLWPSPTLVLCVCMCVCSPVCACVWVGACVCACVCRSEVDIRYQPLWLFALFFETGSITKLGASLFWQTGWPGSSEKPSFSATPSPHGLRCTPSFAGLLRIWAQVLLLRLSPLSNSHRFLHLSRPIEE